MTDFTTLNTEYFYIDDPNCSFEKLRSFAEQNDEFASVVETFDAYCDARTELVDAVPTLLHAPIPCLLGDTDLLAAAETYLEHYRTVQDKLDKKYRALQEASTQGSRRLLADFLLLDTIVMKTEGG